MLAGQEGQGRSSDIFLTSPAARRLMMLLVGLERESLNMTLLTIVASAITFTRPTSMDKEGGQAFTTHTAPKSRVLKLGPGFSILIS